MFIAKKKKKKSSSPGCRIYDYLATMHLSVSLHVTSVIPTLCGEPNLRLRQRRVQVMEWWWLRTWTRGRAVGTDSA